MHGGTVSERPPVLTTRLPVQHPVSDRCRSIHKEVTKNKKHLDSAVYSGRIEHYHGVLKLCKPHCRTYAIHSMVPGKLLPTQ